ncbi:hypothetical protein C8R44DRAFT_892869 [Mycena epipterygia]|nr:hypothetical protein C8R44DRAFT_892869 [Mycena epipterygia]
MAPKSWADAAQTEWLHGWMGDFMRRQGEAKLHLFWPALVEAWFHKWPEHTSLGLPMANNSGARPLTDAEMLLLGAAIKVRKGQLENWFRNHRKKIGDATAAAVQTRSTAALFKNIFKLTAPKRRHAHQPVEHFQLRNADLIAKALDDEGYNALTLEGMEDVDWTNEADSTEAGRNKRLKSDQMCLRMRVVSALWAEADDDEKEAVEALVEAEKEVIRVEELKVEAELDPSVPDACTVWEMQDGIDAWEPVYTEVHKATFNASGWVGMTIVGGPNPRMGGEFSYKIVCFGETPAGNDFEDSCADFDKNVTEPSEEFLSTVFTAQEQRARAYPSRPEPEADPRSASRRSDGDADEAVPAAPPKKTRKRAPRRKKGPASATIAAIAPVAAVPVVGSVEGDIACSTPSSTPTPSDTVGSHSPHSDSFLASVLPCFTPHLSSADEGDILDGFSIGDMFDGFNFDTMMLDPAASSSPPSLLPPSSPSPASAAPVSPFTLRPIPRPTYKGATYVPLAALETANVGGYNFPLESPPHSQAISTSLAPTALAPAPGTPSTGTFTSMMACAMYKIINQPAPTTAPRVAPAPTTPAAVPTAPVVVARAPTTPAVVAPAPAPAIVAPAPTPAVVAPVPMPAPAIVAPAPTPALVAPAPTIPVILATASAIPIVMATSIIPVVANEFPKSRPPAKVPTAKKGAAVKDAAAAPKTRAKAAKKTGQLKAGTVAAEKQLAAVTTVQKVVEVEEKIVVEESGGDEGVAVEESAGGEVAVKRGRGRPKKIVVESARGEGAAASAVSMVTAPIAPLAPALIYSMPSNNTMAFNRAVEKRRVQEISEKAARKKAEENAALLVQAAKGWHTPLQIPTGKWRQ